MEIIDSICVEHNGIRRCINPAVGDLANLPPEHAVGAIMVSAFSDDDAPMSATLILALDRRGISVAAIAERKAVDLDSSHRIGCPMQLIKPMLDSIGSCASNR